MFQRSTEANRRNLQTMESSRSNRLRRFGEHMPTLLNAIQEAHKRGQFKHRPRGPLGKIWSAVGGEIVYSTHFLFKSRSAL